MAPEVEELAPDASEPLLEPDDSDPDPIDPDEEDDPEPPPEPDCAKPDTVKAAEAAQTKPNVKTDFFI
jgi:hypothetical protein